MLKFIRILVAFFIYFSFNQYAIAIIDLPGAVQPGVIGNVISESLPTSSRSTVGPSLQAPEETKVPYNAEAAKIKFTLNKVILEGNTVYSKKEIEKLYKDKLKTKMSVLDFQQIVQSITNYYRNNGYILSRAIIPPQHVKNGVIKVSVLEGFIDKIKIQGDARNSKDILEKYGKHITESKPIHLSVLERYLRLANEVPGVIVKGVLEPSKKRN
ncbi:hypothetical protein N9L02_01545 [Gammaproteobacteria bacterium]|nr:hypothetical protein [Gammaproteobacteria bacterium]